MRRILLPFILCTTIINLDAQNDWVDKMGAPNANFYEIQQDFNTSWRGRDATEKGKGYKVYKRWEEYVAPRVYPSGDLSMLNYTPINYTSFLKEYKKNNSANKMLANASWKPLGPFGGLSSQQRSGRLNFITLHPTDKNTIWAGAPTGGLWKTTDGGSNWTTNTDQLEVTGSSDLAIDPKNPNIMYLATGDADGRKDRSIGVLKSIDGGNTWKPTGLKVDLSQNLLIYRLIINPDNTQILIAATNSGIQKTTDGGVTWTLTYNEKTCDLEFKPGDPNTVYAAGATFKLSTDGGSTWKEISNGITTTSVDRMAIAVTKADPEIVYVVAAYDKASGTNSYGFQGCYKSTNSGVQFSKVSSSPNLMGWAAGGNDKGGQGWYTLAFAASPINKNEIVVGGVNSWISKNGGSSWSLNSHWTGGGAPFVHADHHDMEYDNDGNLYSANDGTIFRSANGSTSWREVSGKMNISQIYKIGTSSRTANRWVTGHQDNGSGLFNGTSYSAVYGGDGLDCFIDRTNDNNVFVSYVYGDYKKSTNGGASVANCTNGMGGKKGDWLSPWKQDPTTSQRLYAGYVDMYVSNNLAGSWSSIGNPGGGGKFVTEFAISKSNNKVLYVLKSTGVFKTTNGGTSWKEITGTLPISATLPNSCLPTSVTINPTDENMAWVTFSGYATGNKIFMTTDGGTSWVNISSNLPNIPANCTVYQDGANDRIFLGMDRGVYYKDKNSTDWTLYNTDLPNTVVRDMEISPAAPGKIRAATYGRGVWEVDISSIVTSVNDKNTENVAFNLFPNPASDNININIHIAENAKVTIDVIDLLGRSVMKIAENENLTQGLHVKNANTNLLPNGVYSVRVITNGKASVKLLNVIH